MLRLTIIFTRAKIILILSTAKETSVFKISSWTKQHLKRLFPEIFFIKKLSKRKVFSFIKEVFHKKMIFLSWRKFSFIKDVFHKQRFFIHQGSSPQAKIFPSSRRFPTSRYFFFIKEVFHKQIFFLHQESFPQVNIFPSSRRFSTWKDFSFNKEVFHKGFFVIVKVFSKQSLFTKNLM